MGLAGFGVAFIFLGMLLFFDKGLLAIGNVRLSLWCFNWLYLVIIHRRSNARDWHRTNTSILLSTTQNQRNDIILWRYICGADWLADRWYAYRNLGFRAAIRVSVLCDACCVRLPRWMMCCCRAFLPVAINFLRRIPVVGQMFYLPGIKQVMLFSIYHNSTHYI